MTLEGLTTKGLYGLILAMTPTERWQAARTPDKGLLTNHWFILLCLVVMVALTGLLFWVSLRRVRQEHRASDQAFLDLAGEKSLTLRECQVLQMIAKHSGGARQETVFSDPAVFERGAVQLIEKSLVGKAPSEEQRLIAEVSLLRQKIGIGKEHIALGAAQSRTMSSRQIPVAKRVTLQPMSGDQTPPIDAMVQGNTDRELCLQLDEAVKVTLTDLWTVRYVYGASIWQFDASVISYDGTILTLSHSHHVRYVNRRRFLRVPVTRRARVARFPFEQRVEWAVPKGEGDERGPALVHPVESHGSPEFVPATITELGGPGIRIETSLDVKTGDRVLVVFDLEGAPMASGDASHRGRHSRLIEDVGEVRHVKALAKGVSMAVELSGLKDAEVSELIRATNAALVEVNDKSDVVPGTRRQSKRKEVAV